MLRCGHPRIWGAGRMSWRPVAASGWHGGLLQWHLSIHPSLIYKYSLHLLNKLSSLLVLISILNHFNLLTVDLIICDLKLQTRVSNWLDYKRFQCNHWAGFVFWLIWNQQRWTDLCMTFETCCHSSESQGGEGFCNMFTKNS